MMIIGEKINGTCKQVGAAIRDRDASLIQRLALEQVDDRLAIETGMDSAIMDPSSPGIAPLLLAADAVLGRDRFCNKYNRAYRTGKFGSM